MGNQQNRNWQYVCFCITCLIGIYFYGCASQQKIQKDIPQKELPPQQPIQKCREDNEHLQRSDELLARGQLYRGARREPEDFSLSG